MSLISDQLQAMQIRHRLVDSHAGLCQTSISSCEECTAACSSMLQPHSSEHLPDMGKDVPDTIAAVQGRCSDVLAKEMTKAPNSHMISWQHQQHGQLEPMPSYAPSELLPQLQLQPQHLQEIEKAVEKAVVTAVTKLVCSADQQNPPSAAAAAAADMVALAAQQQQQQQHAAAATAFDHRSAYVRQLLAAGTHASAACSTASPSSCWSSIALAEAAQTGLQATWQQQQQLLPMSPVLSPYGSLGAFSGTADASTTAASCGSSCTKVPAATAGPAPPPPAATPRRPASVRRRTFNCMPQFSPAGSVAATTAATPTAAGRVLEPPWATGHGAMFVGCPPHLLSNSLARASSTGDIGTYPAGIGQVFRRHSSSSNSSCCCRLSECSSGFASSRSSNYNGSTSSTSSSPLAMPTPLALKACNSCGQLQRQAAAMAAVSPGQQLHPPSIPARQPSQPQEPPSATGATPGKTSPRMKLICPAAPTSPFAAAPSSAAAGRHNSRFAPVAPPRTLLQRGACGGAELRSSVRRYRRHSTSLSDLAGEAFSLSDGAVGAAASVLDGAGFGGADCARFRWAGRSLDGRALGGNRLPASSAGNGGGAAAMVAAVGATGMAGQ